MNSNKLYVGGLPYSVTDDKLQEIFSPHGTVRVSPRHYRPNDGSVAGFWFRRNEFSVRG